MKTWLDKDGNIVYQHYRKPMASKQVISARSAHVEAAKRAVLVSECVQRMVNTSRRLDWGSMSLCYQTIVLDWRPEKINASFSYKCIFTGFWQVQTDLKHKWDIISLLP